jgi:hypothetical protein
VVTNRNIYKGLFVCFIMEKTLCAFGHYNDSGAAKRVFRAYVGDRFNSINEVRRNSVYGAVMENSDADDLDFALDSILGSGSVLSCGGGGSPFYVDDPDSNGGWSNVVAAVESR